MPSASTETTTQTRPQSAGGGASGEVESALVELKGVHRRYGRLVALRGVNLAIQPGEFIFVIGPSEAGKTTLLKLLHGDLRPNRGTIRVEQHRLDRRWRPFLTQHRRDVAAVFQDQRLMRDMTARGQVAFALQVTDLGMPHSEVRVRAQSRLDEVGLGARPAAYPNQLSGGQQRRLAIARALGHDPVLLLADEPTANLDRANAERVLELLERRCAAGTTVVVATHDVELALSRPHRIIELREGRIVADTPARAPLLGNGTAAALLAARHRAAPGLGARTGHLMQLVLGYTPPPPRAPRPKVSVEARRGHIVQFVLGYAAAPRTRPAARVPATGPWVPPREVLDRVATNLTATGVTNGTNGATNSATTNGWNGRTNGAGRVHEPLPAAAGGPAAANGHARHRTALGRLASEMAQLVLGYTPPPPPTGSRPRVSPGRRIGQVMQFVLGYTPPPERPKQARAARRWPWTPVANVGRLAVGGAVASWLRNFGTAAPALGSITLLLLLAGILSVSGFALRDLLVSQSAEASVLHVYLADDAASGQVDQTRHALAAMPHVRAVKYIDKAQALAQAQQRPGLGDLASLSDSNPFPASFEVTVDSPNNVPAVAKAAAGEPGVDPRSATSYDAGIYDRLRQFTAVAAGVAGAFGLFLLIITYVISSNSIRAAVLARRDELLTMQLVGASPWLVRMRLGVEGALTGGLAGVLAAVVVAGTCLAALYGARHLFVEVLPGLTVPAVAEALTAVAALGMCLGVVSALFAFRRLRT